MKYIYLTIILFLFSNQSIIAQKAGKIQGIIHNAENKPLEKATVSIIDLQDSSVLSYTLTDSKGKFDFVRLPQLKNLSLFVSHINTANFSKDFKIDESGSYNFEIITLHSTPKNIDEVLVTALPPVRMNKDTLEYNADYFKTRPNANVEELLKQLPGLQVNMDGTIYYEGKEVSQVKVNGKDFFSSDLRIPTRNLDASLIKTIQVYRDKGESKKIVEDEEKLPITINLKFKKEFLRTDFGKAYGSAGTRDRYEAGALFNSFRDTLQVSLIGYGNNINRESFDYNELNQHAGLGRAENYGFNDFGGRNYNGLGNDIGLGFNLNNDWGKKTKLNIMYMYKHKKELGNQENKATSLFDKEEQFSANNYRNQEKSNAHNLKTLLRHRFDTTAYFEIRPSLTLTNRNSNSSSNSSNWTLDKDLSSSDYSTTNKGNSLNYDHSFYLEKQFSKKHLMSFSNNLSLNKNESDNLNDNTILMYQLPDQNTTLWENQQTKTKGNNLYLSTAYYNKSLEKLNFDYYVTFNKSNSSPIDNFYYNKNGQGIVHGTPYHNSYHFESENYISGIKFYWKPSDKLQVNFGTAYQIKNTSFDLIAINQFREINKHYWLPNIDIRYKSFNINWSKDVQDPNTSLIQSQTNDLNPTYIGLPSLESDQIVVQNANISFNKYEQKYQFGVNASVRYADKSTAFQSWTDLNTGQNTYKRIQSGSTYNYNASLYFRYNFKKGKDWQFYTATQPYFYSYQNYRSINDIDSKAVTYSINLSQEFSLVWKDKIGIIPKYSLSANLNRNSVKDNSNFPETNYLTHDIGAGLNITAVKGFTLETTYSLQNRATGITDRSNFNIWSSSLYYTLKNNSQIKLSAFDILNQNVTNYWGTNGNTTYYTNMLTLRQYFLLGYIHKFKFTKTK